MIVLTSAPVGQCNEAEILIYRLNNRKGDVYKQKYVFGGFESLIYKVSRNVYPESLDETINGILEDLLEGSGFTGAQLSQPLPNSMNSLQIRVARTTLTPVTARPTWKNGRNLRFSTALRLLQHLAGYKSMARLSSETGCGLNV
ncbi:hypothetical protein SeMB42_g04083 [Synchytrium endobioticum]|uniref:Uncharacterized protein n=1 Tax=Synchytrium endobioticum TaxID=286115 RepID=A0A507D1N3_9FUNG|nr:hypothetical protein SeMB42_g04083 [Synchytrium endobioticum]